MPAPASLRILGQRVADMAALTFMRSCFRALTAAQNGWGAGFTQHRHTLAPQPNFAGGAGNACMALVTLRNLASAPRTAGAGSHQTPIVDELWRRRCKPPSTDPATGNATPKPVTAANTPSGEADVQPLATRSGAHSLTEITYAFSDPANAELVDSYTNPWGHLRVGRLLEDLDALAGTVAYKHCTADDSGMPAQHLVTAAVDRIHYRQRPNVVDDILLSGSVIWVGRSSMIIQMLARSALSPEPFVEAYFTFVARDAVTGAASAINPLAIATPRQQELFNHGEALNSQRRRERQLAKESLMGQPIDGEVGTHSPPPYACPPSRPQTYPHKHMTLQRRQQT